MAFEDCENRAEDDNQPAEDAYYGKGYAGDYSTLTFGYSGQCKHIVSEYGGEVKAAPSRLVDYVVLGENPGLKRLDRIHSLGLKVITKREFFGLIIRRSPHFRNLATPERIAGRQFERNPSPPLGFNSWIAEQKAGFEEPSSIDVGTKKRCRSMETTSSNGQHDSDGQSAVTEQSNHNG
ncbi:hypothetical protein LTR85_011776 [Meristemomyces frigidus]|nr:hypothetical protein LTR85_011776 [Meristemomyces frigidus]